MIVSGREDVPVCVRAGEGELSFTRIEKKREGEEESKRKKR